MNINTMTLAARDFSARRGVSDEHIPQWICKERATKSGRKRTAARRVAPNLACGSVARRLQTHGGVCLTRIFHTELKVGTPRCGVPAPCRRGTSASLRDQFVALGTECSAA